LILKKGIIGTMRLIRFGMKGREMPGILTADGKRRSVSGFSDWNSAFFEGDGLKGLAALLRDAGEDSFPEVPESTRWAAPIARPGKIICVGLNYSDHARESGMPIPDEPIVFLKASNTIVGPFDDIYIPRGSRKTDWEVELGVVIGREARYLASREVAMQHVAGFCISHDVSEREFQLERGGQWTKGKSCDTFNPTGPWLLTPDSLPAGHSFLNMHLSVNGVQRQRGTTATMIFDVPYLIHYLSQFMTLEPGDLISTGTPPGVGFGMKPPQYLEAGDVVEVAIDELGRQRQLCIAS
jgi:2-keto-4-pentenoate hydratase/2-oxohepta-3-ene-1,7-dioic acid hydratase in catechol pathway